jgi:hypothetical protein
MEGGPGMRNAQKPTPGTSPRMGRSHSWLSARTIRLGFPAEQLRVNAVALNQPIKPIATVCMTVPGNERHHRTK